MRLAGAYARGIASRPTGMTHRIRFPVRASVALLIAIGVVVVGSIVGETTPGIVLAGVTLICDFAYEGFTKRADERERRAGIVRRALIKDGPLPALDERLPHAVGLVDAPAGVASHGELPPYAGRDVDGTLRTRLISVLSGAGRNGGRCLLVQGETGAGMTRTAFEGLLAAGREFAERGESLTVLVPAENAGERDPSALAQLLALDPFPVNTAVVLWLDQLDTYLRPGATLTVADLGQL